MENIFENAKFGDKFLTRDGRIMLYLCQMPDNSDFQKVLGSDINIEHFHSNGQYCEKYPLPCDIISKWQEPINEEELDKKSHNYKIGYNDGLADGYRKAKEIL